ncbi:hypothetical protein K4S32_11155 [Staphylococcus epidermidis]|nr:hypothetical protein [Staphylococcus epidermidis]
MAKKQKDDDYLGTRTRSINAQRNYEYEVKEIDENTGELVLKDNAPSEEEWKQQVIDEVSEIGKNSEFCYFIFHDQDRLENGNKKPLHVHIVAKFKNAKTIRSLMKQLNISRAENISSVKSYKGALMYLLHITNQARKDGKFVYSMNDLYMYGSEIIEDERFKFKHYNTITGGNGNEEKEVKQEINERLKNVLNDILEKGAKVGKKLVDDLKEEFPENHKDVVDAYYSYYNKFLNAEKDYFEDLANKKSLEGRTLKNTYICGVGGSGKTQLANALAKSYADERGVHSASPKSDDKTYDPADGYDFQKVTVFNEMQGGLFNPREFMDVFDQHNFVAMSSRNKNVKWLSEYAFMTSSKTFERFRNETFRYSKGGSNLVDEEFNGKLRFKENEDAKDEAYQFTRRFSHLIEIVKREDYKFINVYVFDEKKYGFRLQKQIPVSEEFYLDEKEKNKIVGEVRKCFDNPEKDITKGKVKKDKDLIQNKEDIHDFDYYNDDFVFNYKEYPIKEIGTTYYHEFKSKCLTKEVESYIKKNREEYEKYVAKTKFNIDGVREDYMHLGEVIYSQDEEVWAVEFFEYDTNKIICRGLTYQEEQENKVLQDKINQKLDNQKQNDKVEEISKYRNVEVSKNISQHDEFNAKLGIKDEDYVEHNENQTKHMTNPFDI